MKETKKMLAIIEKQYREANNQYNKQLKKQKTMQKIFNIGLAITWVILIYLMITIK